MKKICVVSRSDRDCSTEKKEETRFYSLFIEVTVLIKQNIARTVKIIVGTQTEISFIK